MGAGNTRVDKDGVASSSIPGSHVQAFLLAKPSAGVPPVPGSDTLLFDSHIPRNPRVELSREVPHSVVSGLTGRPNLALESVLATTVKKMTAEGVVPPAVLAGGPWRAEKQTQAVRKTDLEVLVWHGLGDLFLKEERDLQKPTRAKTSSRLHIHLVDLPQTVAQSLSPVFLQLGGPENLQLRLWLNSHSNPIYRL